MGSLATVDYDGREKEGGYYIAPKERQYQRGEGRSSEAKKHISIFVHHL